MLVLTRKLNETIIIDDQIRITVLEIRPGQVRLGIEAPREIPVMREELRPATQAGQATELAEAAELAKASVAESVIAV